MRKVLSVRYPQCSLWLTKNKDSKKANYKKLKRTTVPWHTSLLNLDAVVQQKHTLERQLHIALTWEAHHIVIQPVVKDRQPPAFFLLCIINPWGNLRPIYTSAFFAWIVPCLSFLPSNFPTYISWTKKDTTFWDKVVLKVVNLELICTARGRAFLISIRQEFQRSDTLFLSLLLSYSTCSSSIFRTLSLILCQAFLKASTNTYL